MTAGAAGVRPDSTALRRAVDVIEAFVGDLDPAVVDGRDAANLVRVFARGERLCGAGKALAARRVATTDAHRADGATSATKWLATQSGTTSADAEKALKTAERLEDLPDTAAAYRAGELSHEQAEEITSAAAADPSAERRLLNDARHQPVAQIRRTCRTIRAAAAGDSAVAERNRIQQTRYLRTWASRDGAYEGRFRLAPDAGAVIATALQAAHHHDEITYYGATLTGGPPDWHYTPPATGPPNP